MIHEVLDRLDRDRGSISKEWARQVSLISSAYSRLDIEDLERSADRAFLSVLPILRSNDFEHIDQYIQWLTRKRTEQGISFTELQQAFSKLRYILYDSIGTRVENPDFLEMVSRINQAVDWIVFRFSLYFKEHQEQKLRGYANSLEHKVRKRTAELEESKRNYQVLFDEISDGCFVWQNGHIILANKGFCEMHGHGAAEVLGTPYDLFVADDFIDMVERRFSNVLKGEPNSDCFVFFRKGKGGERLPTESKIKLIHYNGCSAVLVLCSDITQRLEIEEKLRQQDRFALIGSLTTSIAHEIRNPLSAIKVNTQILLDRLSLSGNDQKRLEISYQQLRYLEKTISQMLDYSKPIRLNYTVCDIHRTIDYALELIGEKLEDKRVEVYRDYEMSLPKVMIDSDKIVASVFNVLKNAIEAMDEQKKPPRIWIYTERYNSNGRDYIRLSIEDNGIGIAAEERETVFEPFFTKGKIDGIGLGLSIVRKIVEAHHGEIRAAEGTSGETVLLVLIPINVF
ncbi:MAG: ATP-binding protein [Desulfobacteraceae bacterium]|jgi:PAS domain S-box-containing protein